MGGGPFVGGGFGWEGDGRITGGAGEIAVLRGSGGGAADWPRDGRGGGEDAELLLERDGEAAEDVRLGGGGKVIGFVFWLTKLKGGGGGGGGLPL